MKSSLSIEAFRKTLLFFSLVIVIIELISFYPLIQDSVHQLWHFQEQSFVHNCLSILDILSYLLYWISTVTLISLVLFVISLYYRHYKMMSALSIFVFSIYLIYINIDLKLFQSYRFHLTPHSIAPFLSADFFHFFHLSQTERHYIFMHTTAYFALVLVLFYMSSRHYYRFSLNYNIKYLINLFITVLAWVLLNLVLLQSQLKIEQAQYLNKYPGLKPLLSLLQNQTPSTSSIQAIYKPKIKADLNTHPHPYNIIWIMVDTLRVDAINPIDMPKLYQFARNNYFFTQHYSSGNATQAGVFGMLYGLPGNYFQSSIQFKQQPFLFDVLEHADYQFQFFWSGSLKMPDFENSLLVQRNRDDIHLTQAKDANVEDQTSIKQLENFLSKQESRPYFAYLNLNSVHAYCQNHDAKQADCNRLSDKPSANIKTHYWQAVRSLDTQLANLLQRLAHQSISEHSIIIITSDHGESFNEHHDNLWGHGNSFADEVIHVPLIVHWPHKSAAMIQYPSSHYDISSTLIDYLLDMKIPEQNYGLGHSLFRYRNNRNFLCSDLNHSILIQDEGHRVLTPSDQDMKVQQAVLDLTKFYQKDGEHHDGKQR